jgi:GTP-binding protein
MKITEAKFVMSNTEYQRCPPPDKPEYAFIGRSNVGKSSLINMVVNNKSLAKTSQTPGKTQVINHFIINNQWYLVDLPGYGFAKVSKSDRANWEVMIADYLINRSNLQCVFVLIDVRHEPQRIDLEFLQWLGENDIAFELIFTKSDKVKPAAAQRNVEQFEAVMLQTWESMPTAFITSAEKHIGRTEILDEISELNKSFVAPDKF